MVLRWDDTNPKNEDQVFTDNIKQDLNTLGIKWERETHTSDYFDQILVIARDMI